MAQVRDGVLAGLGQDILAEVHGRIDKALGEPLMRELHVGAEQKMGNLLAEPGSEVARFGSEDGVSRKEE